MLAEAVAASALNPERFSSVGSTPTVVYRPIAGANPPAKLRPAFLRQVRESASSSSVSRVRDAAVTDDTLRSTKRRTLFEVSAKALVAMPALGVLSYIPSLGGLAYAAIASMIIAGLAGLAASEA